MAATIKDVARHAGVSYGTVSRVLNDRAGVHPNTKASVLKAVKDLGYQPNAIARNLVMQQSNTIALVVPDVSSPFFGALARSVEKEALAHGYNTILYNTNYDLNLEKSVLKWVSEQRVDGIIIKPAKEGENPLGQYDIPTVLVSHFCSEGVSYIDIENELGGKLAGQHLVDCGYKKLCFLGGYKAAKSTQKRFKGFAKVLEDAGLELEDKFILYGSYSIENGYNVFNEMIQAGDIPQAIFCGNDEIALGVMQRADEEGLKIPEDLGIIGFDDVLIASLPRIRLTTIAQPIKQMGAMAADILLKSLTQKDELSVQKILLQPVLKIRGTTGKW